MWWDTGKSARPLGYPSSTGGGTFVLEDLITITNAEQSTPTSWVIQTAAVFPSKTPEPTASSGSTFPEPTALSVSGHGLSTGEKAGVAVGAVAGSALVTGVIYWIIRMQRKLAVQNERLSWIEDANSVAPGKPAFLAGSPTQETATSVMEEQSTAQHEMNVPDAIVEIGEMDSQQRHDGPHEMPEK